MIFVGLNVSAEHGATLCPVAGVERGDLHVLKNGQLTKVPVREFKGFTTKTEPKCSNVSLEVVDLKGERVYTHGNDPGVAAIRERAFMLNLQAGREERAEIDRAEAARAVENIQGGGRNAPGLREAQQRSSDANSRYSAVLAEGSSGRFDSLNAAGAAAEGRYDAFDVTCRISAPKEIENAYVALRVVFRDPANLRFPAVKLKFFPLPALVPMERKVTFRLEGFPAGFSVDKCDVHAFVGAQELATSLSSNRIEVSEEEAHQYFVLRHIHSNSAGQFPAQVIPELLPAGLNSQIPIEHRSLAIDFSVNRDGMVSHLELGANSRTISSDLAAQLRTIRFYPALSNGVPANSVANFALSELIR